jgi:hypothetical protein
MSVITTPAAADKKVWVLRGRHEVEGVGGVQHAAADKKVWVLRGAWDIRVFWIDENDDIWDVFEDINVPMNTDKHGKKTIYHSREWAVKEWNRLIADGYVRDRELEMSRDSLMMYEDLQFGDITKTSISGNQRAMMFFPNGYGVSVISGPYQPGRPGGYEIAVLKGVDSDWEICYDTDITGDVICVDNSHKVDDVMKQIQELENV